MSSIQFLFICITGGIFTHEFKNILGSWQNVNKRLTIPRSPTTDSPSGTKPITVQETEIKTQKNNGQKKHLSKNLRDRRSVKESRSNERTSDKHDNSNHDDGEKGHIAKRQFILTRPLIPQTPQFVAYVPVLPSSQIEARSMATIPESVGERSNLAVNFPLKTSGTFILSLPSLLRGNRLYTTNPSGSRLSDSYKPLVNPGIVADQQGTTTAMAVQRSAAVMEAPDGFPPVSLAELAGIQGQPVVQNSRHFTMLYNNEHLPTQVQDQFFGGSLLEGRTRIPGLDRRRRRFRSRYWNRLEDQDHEDEYPEDYDDERKLYNDELPSDMLSERVEDDGSYSEKILPDGRVLLKKNHVGFGPITVQAKTANAASRDQDDVTDMDLDSDKRKQIPHPSQESSYIDKRLGIPTPSDEKGIGKEENA